jgi:PAS domain S-box-containing protein
MKRENALDKNVINRLTPYLALFDKKPIYILISDTEGNILYINTFLQKALSYKAQDLNKIQLNKIIFDENKPIAYTELGKFLNLQSSQKDRITFYYKTKNDEKIPAEGFIIKIEEEEIIYMIVANNIAEKTRLVGETNKLRAELDQTLSKYPELKLWRLTQKKDHLELVDKSIEALKKSQKNYKQILENISEGYIEFDLGGKIIYVNRGLSKMLGYRKSELFGKTYKDLLSENQTEKLKRVLENGLNQDTYEFEVSTKQGNKIIIETSILLRKEQGEEMGSFGVIRDITSRKQNELLQKEFRKELERKVKNRTKKLNEALESQKRLMDEILKTSQFKSEFLANFSHELRTPLNAIMGFTDLLLEQTYGGLKEDQKDFLMDIRDSSNHLLDLIDKILDISHIESRDIDIKKEVFSLDKFIGQIRSTFYHQFDNKNLQFSITNINHIQQIKTDPIRLKQILFNLLNNAYKFTFKGQVDLIILQDDENIIFKVKDTGIGIEKKDYEIIFKEFERPHSYRASEIPGSGLGLPLTKRLVHLLDGNISFESEVGIGSVFQVEIPKIVK